MISEMRHHRHAFGSLSNALKRLVISQAAQLGKAVALGRIVQQITAKDSGQIGLGDEWRERKEPKPAFRAVAAPATSACRWRLFENRIAATKLRKILGILREPAGYLDFRERPQQRKVT